MTILETGDATEIESILDVAHAIDGPVYLRMLRGEVSRLFDKSEPMKFNTARVISNGSDITLLTSGITTEEAMRASKVLAERGVQIEHLHISTLKPFTDPQVLASLHKATHGVITMENHSNIGGLGSIVAEVMAENAIGKPLVRIGLNDTYAHGASQKYLLSHYQLDAMALIKKVEKLLDKELNITESDIPSARDINVHSSAKVEAL
jgi:transketolase